ncbi:MAG: hypothetical protein MUC88_26715 [Planctomycetes bacterium]|nr:hypothetical protein [Planctomycetota bacterium]
MSYLATDTVFTYDAAGNRIDVNDASGVTPCTTNSLNQYTQADGGIKGFRYEWHEDKG